MRPKVVFPHSTTVVVAGLPIFDNPSVSSLPYLDGYSPSPGTPELDGDENMCLAMKIEHQNVAQNLPTPLMLY